MTPAATCRSVNHTLTHREANALELALSRSRSPHNAPHSPSYINLRPYIRVPARPDQLQTVHVRILIRGARVYCPTRRATRSGRPHPLSKPLPHRGRPRRAVHLRVAGCARGIVLHVYNCPMVGTSQQGDRWWLELTVDSATMSKTLAGAEQII